MINKGIVYLIVNNIDNKKYVGVTTSPKGIEGRYKNGIGLGMDRVYTHLLYCKENDIYYNEHLLRAIEKYGRDNFYIISDLDSADNKNDLFTKEKFWIKQYNSNDARWGYNYTSGGEGSLGWSKNKDSLAKYRKSKNSSMNYKLQKWYLERITWDNKFLCIWDFDDGLDKERKKILFKMLAGCQTTKCIICEKIISSTLNNICTNCSKDKSTATTKRIVQEKEILNELKQQKSKIIKLHIKEEKSLGEIIKILEVKGLTNKILTNFLNESGIKIINHVQRNNSKIIYNAIKKKDEIINVFKYKYEAVNWINEANISLMPNGFTNQRHSNLLRNGKDYNGYTFTLIDEQTYHNFHKGVAG